MKKNLISLSVGLLISGLALANSTPATVDINTADKAALSAVHGIGKRRAENIIKYRQGHGAFKNVHDLILVKGFTEKSLQNLLKHYPGQITV